MVKTRKQRRKTRKQRKGGMFSLIKKALTLKSPRRSNQNIIVNSPLHENSIFFDNYGVYYYTERSDRFVAMNDKEYTPQTVIYEHSSNNSQNIAENDRIVTVKLFREDPFYFFGAYKDKISSILTENRALAKYISLSPDIGRFYLLDKYYGTELFDDLQDDGYNDYKMGKNTSPIYTRSNGWKLPNTVSLSENGRTLSLSKNGKYIQKQKLNK
jgi:hypothetical protein